MVDTIPADICCPLCGGTHGKHDPNCAFYKRAAAEVETGEADLREDYIDMIKADMKERCAQVVDVLAKRANRGTIVALEEAAAAIRALKP